MQWKNQLRRKQKSFIGKSNGEVFWDSRFFLILIHHPAKGKIQSSGSRVHGCEKKCTNVQIRFDFFSTHSTHLDRYDVFKKPNETSDLVDVIFFKARDFCN